MPPEKESSPLGELEQELYDKNAAPHPVERTKLVPRLKDIKRQWANGGAEAEKPLPKAGSNSLLIKLLIFSIVFFVGTLAVAGFIVYRGSNQISGRNIGLEVKGPVAVKAGDETSLQVMVENRNTTELQDARLLIEFPTDTQTASSSRADLARGSETIGSIDSGETINRTVSAVFFGSEDEEKVVRVKMEYKIPGSNALYTKETEYVFAISEPPVELSADILSEVVSGEDVTLKIRAAAKTTDTLKNTILIVDYPAGFTFKNADVKPSYRNNAWLFSELSAGDTETITITGNLQGFNNDKKTFRMAIGSQDPIGEDTIAFTYNDLIKTIAIEEPFIGVGIKVNGSVVESPTVPGDELVRIDIDWANNLPTSIIDGTIDLKITGAAVDEARVQAGRGFYRASEDTILWTKVSEPKLATIEAGSEDSTSFTFYTKPLVSADLGSTANPTVKLELVFTGTRVSEGFAGEKVTTTIARTIRLETAAQFATRALHHDGPFQNTGPLPPQVDKETTYTVVWSVLNSSNTLRDTMVKTVLPPYVNWKDIKQPANEELVFNPTSRELVWKLGRVTPGSSAREVSFQLGLVPVLSQVGQAPALTGPATFSAFDTFTETVIESQKKEISTKLSTDSNYNLKDSMVAP